MLLGAIWVSTTPLFMDYPLGATLLGNIVPGKDGILSGEWMVRAFKYWRIKILGKRN